MEYEDFTTKERLLLAQKEVIFRLRGDYSILLSSYLNSCIVYGTVMVLIGACFVWLVFAPSLIGVFLFPLIFLASSLRKAIQAYEEEIKTHEDALSKNVKVYKELLAETYPPEGEFDANEKFFRTALL
jgi:hypothetical protein